MSDDPNQRKKSLADEIKRRKTQEVQRSMEAEKLKRATGTAPLVQPQSPKPQAPASPRVPSSASTGNLSPTPNIGKRATQAVEAVASARRAAFRGLNTRQKTTLIVATIGLLVIIISVG